jgi:hypothetical protein
MAAQATPVPEAPAEVQASRSKPSKLWKLVALAFMVAVIGGEILVALIYLSGDGGGSSTDHAAEAAASEAEHGHEEASEAGHGDHAAHGEESEPGSQHSGQAPKTGEVEVDLGQFSLTAFQPASNSTLLVDFHLYGTVRTEDAGLFHEQYEKSKHRIRDQVIVTVRCAEMTDFADPGLALIKRQILEKSNTTLGRRLLRGVVFSDFTLIEQ